MCYQVKWIEDNLGITRKALRLYEEKGLISRGESLYRQYSEEDLERLWAIKLLQGMGYTLREISTIAVAGDDFDYQRSIEEKVTQLESKLREDERLLNYAKYIRMTGELPAMPKKMGDIRFDEFYEKSLDEWTTEGLPAYSDVVLDYKLGRITEKEAVDAITSSSGELEIIDPETLKIAALIEGLKDEIILLRSLGADNIVVQALAMILYAKMREFVDIEGFTCEMFVKQLKKEFTQGDIGLSREMQYGKEECSFMVDVLDCLIASQETVEQAALVL